VDNRRTHLSSLYIQPDQAQELIDSDRILVLSRPPVFEEPLRMVRFTDTGGSIVYGITSQRDIELLRSRGNSRVKEIRTSSELSPLDVAALSDFERRQE
jgi:hypothetical protein